MNLHAVKVALAAAVETVESDPPLRCLWYLPDSITPPMAYLQLESVTYDQTFARGQDEIILTVMVMVARADDQSAQAMIDDYLSGSGPLSIKAAIESARGAPGESALDGAADDVHVTGTESPPRWYQFGEERFHGVGLRVRVIGTGA